MIDSPYATDMANFQLDTVCSNPLVIVAELNAKENSVTYWTETAVTPSVSQNTSLVTKPVEYGFQIGRKYDIQPARKSPAASPLTIGVRGWYRAEGGSLCVYNKETRDRVELVNEDIMCVLAEYIDDPEFVLVKLLSGKAALYDGNEQRVLKLKTKHNAITGTVSQTGHTIAIYHTDHKVRIYDFSDVPNSIPKATITLSTGPIVPSMQIIGNCSLVYVPTIPDVSEFISNPNRTTSICRYNYSRKRPDCAPSKRPALISRVELCNNIIVYYDEFLERWMSDAYAVASVYKPTNDGVVAFFDCHGILKLARDLKYATAH